MSEFPLRPVPENFKSTAHIDATAYRDLYQRSVDDPEGFWADMAEQFLQWDAPWDRVCDYDFRKGEVSWFSGGKLNVSVNCIDRHLPQRAEQTALIWEGDDTTQDKHISYAELHTQVCQLANVLRTRGVKKGDRVCIYMPMIPEAAYAMLACTRIGAVHSVVFGGFSPEALKDRILDSDCQTVITADEGVRGGKTIPLKANVDSALEQCPMCIPAWWSGAPVRISTGRRTAIPGTTKRPPQNPRIAFRNPWTPRTPVYSLYLRLYRQTQRRIAHNRGLPATDQHDLQICIRLPGG